MPKKKTDKRVLLMEPKECAIILNGEEIKAVFSQKAEKDMKAPLSENEKLILALEVLLQEEEFIQYLMNQSNMILDHFTTAEEYFEGLMSDKNHKKKETSAQKIKKVLTKTHATVDDLNEMIKEVFNDND